MAVAAAPAEEEEVGEPAAQRKAMQQQLGTALTLEQLGKVLGLGDFPGDLDLVVLVVSVTDMPFTRTDVAATNTTIHVAGEVTQAQHLAQLLERQLLERQLLECKLLERQRLPFFCRTLLLHACHAQRAPSR